jgi:hypothetical protein
LIGRSDPSVPQRKVEGILRPSVSSV